MAVAKKIRLAKYDRRQAKPVGPRPARAEYALTHESETAIDFTLTTSRPIGDFKPAIEELLGRWSDALRRAERTGRPVTMEIKVDPKQPRAAIKVRKPDRTDDLDAALVEARRRGATEIGRILGAADMVSADAFAGMIGATRETVHQKRRRHEVLALQGPKRGYRFPVWQIGSDGDLLPELPRLFQALGPHPWAVYRFLIQRHAELDGITGLEALQSGRLDEVMQVAEAIGAGSFA